MDEERLLLIPGPTNISRRVREAMAAAQLGHTDALTVERLKEAVQLARYAFRNGKGFQYVFTGTGTVAMEAAVSSLIEAGDDVLVLNTGYFGRRFADVNTAYGAKVEELTSQFGAHLGADLLRSKLRQKRWKAVFMTHVDTGSTVCNPVHELVEEVKKADAFAVVDGVCSVGGVELDFDRMGADVVFTASQKALAAPPGALLIATSEDAERHFARRASTIRSYYANLTRWRPIMEDPRGYFATHAVQVLSALREALLEVKQEGLEARWSRHRAIGKRMREGLERQGLGFVAEDGYRADTVTGVWTGDGRAPGLQAYLREKGIDVARGLGDLGARMLRFGHFGNLSDEGIDRFLGTFSEAQKAVPAKQG